MKGVYLASTAGQKETRAIKISLDRKRVEDAMRSGGKFRRGQTDAHELTGPLYVVH
jgi:hypothetical protein